MNSRPIHCVLILCLLALCTAVGCSTSGSGAPMVGRLAEDGTTTIALMPQARPLVKDLPVPMGFKLAENISRHTTSRGSRLVDHTYIGREDKAEVERFYRTQMPRAGWQFRSSKLERAAYVMKFTGHAERCVVRITDERSTSARRTQININVQALATSRAQ